VGVLLSHPEVAYRRCSDCVKWSYNGKTGERNEQWEHKPGRKPRKVPVPLRGKPPCFTCPKCEGLDVRTPEEGAKAELSAKNWLAVRFYFQHKAGDGVMLDGIARKNCGIIECMMEQHRQSDSRAMLMLLRSR
jgi:hypothetical protein